MFKFIDHLQEYKLGHGGKLGYIDAISEFIDFRKVNGASNGVLRKLSDTALYIKREPKTVAKMMRLECTQDLDFESLETRGHWASMEELLEVVPRYKQTVKVCQTDPGLVKPKKICGHLLVHQGERIVSHDLQYLTVEMVKAAKANGGFIDQKTF